MKAMLRAETRQSRSRRRAAAVVLSAGAALWLAAPALAGSGAFSTVPANIGPIKPDTPIGSSDYISVGFSVADHNQHNTALSLSLRGAVAVIQYSCSANGPAQHELDIPLSSAPVSYPASYTANGGWYPTNRAADPSTYQSAVLQFTSTYDRCSGGKAYVVDNAEHYTGTLAATTATSDQLHIQLHTAIATSSCSAGASGAGGPACNVPWNGQQDNLTPAYAPPTPTPASTPTPSGGTGQPTPSPSPSPPGSPAAHAVSISQGGPTNGSGGHPSSSVAGAAATAPPEASAPPFSSPAGPLQRPLPVVLPLASGAAGSLFAHLPMNWFAVLAALDVALALAVIARRRRAAAAPGAEDRQTR